MTWVVQQGQSKAHLVHDSDHPHGATLCGRPEPETGWRRAEPDGVVVKGCRRCGQSAGLFTSPVDSPAPAG